MVETASRIQSSIGGWTTTQALALLAGAAFAGAIVIDRKSFSTQAGGVLYAQVEVRKRDTRGDHPKVEDSVRLDRRKIFRKYSTKSAEHRKKSGVAPIDKRRSLTPLINSDKAR
jgi:hypothetical protein